MGFRVLLLAALTATFLSQLVPQPADTLSSLYRANLTAATEEKAMQYLLLTYP